MKSDGTRLAWHFTRRDTWTGEAHDTIMVRGINANVLPVWQRFRTKIEDLLTQECCLKVDRLEVSSHIQFAQETAMTAFAHLIVAFPKPIRLSLPWMTSDEDIDPKNLDYFERAERNFSSNTDTDQLQALVSDILRTSKLQYYNENALFANTPRAIVLPVSVVLVENIVSAEKLAENIAEKYRAYFKRLIEHNNKMLKAIYLYCDKYSRKWLRTEVKIPEYITDKHHPQKTIDAFVANLKEFANDVMAEHSTFWNSCFKRYKY